MLLRQRLRLMRRASKLLRMAGWQEPQVIDSARGLGNPHTLLWSCACNASLYIEDSGSRQLLEGGDFTVTSGAPGNNRDEWIDAYRAMFLYSVSCDPVAVAVTALGIARKRSRRRSGDVVAVAIAIAEEAVDVMAESGAATDLDARRRLLASMELKWSELAFGALLPVPELVEDAREKWAEEMQ